MVGRENRRNRGEKDGGKAKIKQKKKQRDDRTKECANKKKKKGSIMRPG